MSTKPQIKKIHALKRALGWDDETYKDALADRYSVRSSVKLTFKQAAEFIRYMEKLATETGNWEKKQGRRKYDELKNRDILAASPAQLRMIEAMWKDVSRATNDADRAKALRSFLHRIVGVDDVRFLEKSHVEKVVKALTHMGAEVI